MKKIMVINTANTSFSKRISEEFKLKNQEYFVTFPNEMAFFIDGENLELYCKDELIDPSNITPFVRIGGKFSHFVSFLYLCAQEWNWELNDPIRYYSDIMDKKPAQLLVCHQNSIPFPKSIITTSKALHHIESLIKSKINYPLVLKGYGDRGESVFKIDSYEHLLEQELDDKVTYVIQEYIQIDFDLRVLVYNNQIVGSMKRTSDGFLKNYSQGGQIESYSASHKEEEIAIKAASACKMTFAGVDIIYRKGEPIVLEINLAPQIKGFEIVNNSIDVVNIIANDLIAKANK